jgi:hypothetical protein
VYQKGIMNPMINVEQFWKDYCAFENVISLIVFIILNKAYLTKDAAL